MWVELGTSSLRDYLMIGVRGSDFLDWSITAHSQSPADISTQKPRHISRHIYLRSPVPDSSGKAPPLSRALWRQMSKGVILLTNPPTPAARRLLGTAARSSSFPHPDPGCINRFPNKSRVSLGPPNTTKCKTWFLTSLFTGAYRPPPILVVQIMFDYTSVRLSNNSWYSSFSPDPDFLQLAARVTTCDFLCILVL